MDVRAEAEELMENASQQGYEEGYQQAISKAQEELDSAKQELQKMSDVSAASIAKMGRCENVTTDVLLRICEALDCNVEDIMERVSNLKIDKNTES